MQVKQSGYAYRRIEQCSAIVHKCNCWAINLRRDDEFRFFFHAVYAETPLRKARYAQSYARFSHVGVDIDRPQ